MSADSEQKSPSFHDKLVVKCQRCSAENNSDLKFCGNCGTKLYQASATTIGSRLNTTSLGMLQIIGAIYLLISLPLNSLVRSSPIFWLSYLAAGILGMIAGYLCLARNGERRGISSKYLRPISVLVIAIGFVSTFLLFLLGLGVEGVIGPAWVIFLGQTYVLWKLRSDHGS